MNGRIACILTIFSLFAVLVGQAAALEENSASQVLAEINLARTEPLKYVGFLREFRSRFQGKSYQIPGTTDLIQTSEGAAAVDEAIRFLSRRKPLPPLTWSAGLAAAAAELIAAQGGSGVTGHGGLQTSGMQRRIERHGKWKRRIGENIAYSLDDPRSMVIQMLIDDGIPGRGHRKNLFDPVFTSAGVSCGPHLHFGRMCVIDFSGGFKE
jgi:uncharacterized protein YkwD